MVKRQVSDTNIEFLCTKSTCPPVDRNECSYVAYQHLSENFFSQSLSRLSVLSAITYNLDYTGNYFSLHFEPFDCEFWCVGISTYYFS